MTFGTRRTSFDGPQKKFKWTGVNEVVIRTTGLRPKIGMRRETVTTLGTTFGELPGGRCSMKSPLNSTTRPGAGQISPLATYEVAEVEDWDLLFNAILERLKWSVENWTAASSTYRIENWGQVQANVLECIQDLELLRSNSTHEFGWHLMTDANTASADPIQPSKGAQFCKYF